MRLIPDTLREYNHAHDQRGRFATTPGVKAELVSQLGKPDSGFTYSVVNGSSPTKGFALSVEKREKILDAKTLTLEDLTTYVMENRDALMKSQNYLGAWHNPEDGKIYLDVSTVVDTPQEAERLGRQHNQLAYLDLEGLKSVPIQSERRHGQR